MFLLLLALAQQPVAMPTEVCDAAARLIQVDLRVDGACRIEGRPRAGRTRAYFPFDDLRVAGARGAATDELRAGLETFARVSSPMAELALRGAIEQALSSFERAIAEDPALIEASIAAAELALRSRVEEDLSRALALARATRAEGARLPALEAELEYALGESISIDSEGGAGGGPGLQRLRALELLASERSSDRARGDSLYFDALRRGGPAMGAAIARDLGPLLAPGTTLGAEQAERFWSRAAADAAVDRADRLSEHFRRLAYAYDAYYDWPRIIRRGGEMTTGAVFDARGHVHVRHGAPTEVVHTPPSGAGGNRYETWIYDGAWNQPFTVHFTGASRSWRFAGGHMAALSSQTVDLGLRTLLSVRMSTHRMRDALGRPELLIVGGVPVASQASDAASAQEFTLGMTATVLDAGRTMRASESVRGSTRAMADPGYASIPVVMPAPIAGARIRVVLRDVDSTHVGAGVSATAPAPLTAAERPWMSDLVTLSVDGPGTLARHDTVLSPTPDVVGGARFGIYFELYGREVGEYRARIRARRADAGVVDRLLNRDEVLTVTLNRRPNVVRPGIAAEALIISAPDWEPGEYELEVEITAAGETATRRRTIIVVVDR